MSERKLAKIVKIDDVMPIQGADKIAHYKVGGWYVVDKKDQYNIGDLAVYCEIDSWIPTELAPFLSKGKEPREYNGVKGERLKTIKLRGALSQGLLLPVRNFDGMNFVLPVGETVAHAGNMRQVVEGDDVSEFLNIQKWERPIPAQLAGQVKGNFPSLVPKTDQERIQNLSFELEEYKRLNYTFEVSEKLEGSSCTFYLDPDGEFHVCSRNLDLKEDPNNSFWRVARKYDVENGMRNYEMFGYAIQGELTGPGVQGNHYGHTDLEFHVFDVYMVQSLRYMTAAERICLSLALSLPHTPVVLTNQALSEDFETVGDILAFAEDSSALNHLVEREGVVFKCIQNPEISFKAVSNRYLLGGGE